MKQYLLYIFKCLAWNIADNESPGKCPYRDGADAEREDVGHGGDGDGDAGVLEGQPDLLVKRTSEGLILAQVVPALNDHEHVVDADAWKAKVAFGNDFWSH